MEDFQAAALAVWGRALRGSLSGVLTSCQAEATESLCLYAWLCQTNLESDRHPKVSKAAATHPPGGVSAPSPLSLLQALCPPVLLDPTKNSSASGSLPCDLPRLLFAPSTQASSLTNWASAQMPA